MTTDKENNQENSEENNYQQLFKYLLSIGGGVFAVYFMFIRPIQEALDQTKLELMKHQRKLTELEQENKSLKEDINQLKEMVQIIVSKKENVNKNVNHLILD
jgi:FtsZ-binding cell division protein ZapB